jgi:hypothetical protein
MTEVAFVLGRIDCADQSTETSSLYNRKFEVKRRIVRGDAMRCNELGLQSKGIQKRQS